MIIKTMLGPVTSEERVLQIYGKQLKGAQLGLERVLMLASHHVKDKIRLILCYCLKHMRLTQSVAASGAEKASTGSYAFLEKIWQR